MKTIKNEIDLANLAQELQIEKYFAWYDSDDRYKDELCYGPINYVDQQTIGVSVYHELQDLLKLNIADSLKKRLAGAKVGTAIKFSYKHGNGNLMLKCVSNDSLEDLKKYLKLNEDITNLRSQMVELNKKREKLGIKLRK